ncbi:hypothetical protein [Burkholderia sp. Ac-20345]|uniref:hypothetical protein n=1 Tax=Burkholderia sp. Ac-20345 TaxID=2703891 RepID=UPI002402C1D7|nr:hypothetical protein [Burkholderia sp. Ac-20345]
MATAPTPLATLPWPIETAPAPGALALVPNATESAPVALAPLPPAIAFVPVAVVVTVCGSYWLRTTPPWPCCMLTIDVDSVLIPVEAEVDSELSWL